MNLDNNVCHGLIDIPLAASRCPQTVQYAFVRHADLQALAALTRTQSSPTPGLNRPSLQNLHLVGALERL
ncbi:hypothetical protein ACIPSA_35710 [Streptomyces sp. NPDC086549]|uniref:hypothetical protein n=1 Tax=Streptomyces sp. NPDC086549 TaxID=3365752 RepID=UPI0037F5359C